LTWPANVPPGLGQIACIFAGDCRYQTASNFFNGYWEDRKYRMTVEAAAISANAPCPTYISTRMNRKKVTADIYFQMCKDKDFMWDKDDAIPGSLRKRSNAFINLNMLHQAGGRWLPLSSNAL
jgi:hypothetical protein